MRTDGVISMPNVFSLASCDAQCLDDTRRHGGGGGGGSSTNSDFELGLATRGQLGHERTRMLPDGGFEIVRDPNVVLQPLDVGDVD